MRPMRLNVRTPLVHSVPAPVTITVWFSADFSVHSIGCASTRDIEDAASREGTLLACKPADQGRHLFHRSEASDGDLREHVVDMHLSHLIEDWRTDGSRRDAIHGDVVFRHL